MADLAFLEVGEYMENWVQTKSMQNSSKIWTAQEGSDSEEGQWDRHDVK